MRYAPLLTWTLPGLALLIAVALVAVLVWLAISAALFGLGLIVEMIKSIIDLIALRERVALVALRERAALDTDWLRPFRRARVVERHALAERDGPGDLTDLTDRYPASLLRHDGIERHGGANVCWFERKKV